MTPPRQQPLFVLEVEVKLSFAFHCQALDAITATPIIPPNLEAQIYDLRTPGDWLNLKGLIFCASKYVSTQVYVEGPSLKWTPIFLLGSGTYNYVYRLCFSSGLQLAASIPKTDEKDFFPTARLSEIPTMKLVAESGLYPHVLVPKIHGWEVGFDNETGLDVRW
ncbi:hypothetical protein D9619_008455 [Psilocybe cf. subviscida]|uniref:Uncharacterized protein n=1 Tax=Psilocybe cf. subviscida TaxID=2480587 RepID=A0A8H5BB63_9AGAR|nr:hypothetical protein D9619_008455 [Psilocybe cf. subviscida]